MDTSVNSGALCKDGCSKFDIKGSGPGSIGSDYRARDKNVDRYQKSSNRNRQSKIHSIVVSRDVMLLVLEQTLQWIPLSSDLEGGLGCTKIIVS